MKPKESDWKKFKPCIGTRNGFIILWALISHGKFKYGLGVDLIGKGFIGHAGAVDGYYGRIAHDPETDTTIVVFFNNLSARQDVLVYEGFLHELIDILHSAPK